ncbi:uncharacterized protein KY384_000779 [Bacidia gigantensis]|uniref:uncharacterized protein n=1 Tax=Bacidia gigantensis TaxID=2732470 RepID=UPI001D03E942|nr:uncharacterized protein KY384_000779 [Bacidia gigantensis]KAG8526017.1 hypothetical protein KY384_000779 [Bacidia gigantensis]
MTPLRSPLLSSPVRKRTILLSLSIPPLAYYLTRPISTTTPMSADPPTFPSRPYKTPHTTFPYTATDFHRQDPSTDTSFYRSARFVTHIDDHAIGLLRQYYAQNLPREGTVLDLCSSWVSHFPAELEERARVAVEGKEGKDREDRGLRVVGVGMNKAELDANPILCDRVVQDLNANPGLVGIGVGDGGGGNGEQGKLDATVCVVSIDYLTRPLEVLDSVRAMTREGGMVHLVVSNRCFPTKAVSRWLRISEEERLEMVGDYLAFSGWEGVEIVEVCDGRVKEGEGAEDKGEVGRLMGFLGMGSGRVDPLWVVRGRKGGE